MGQYKGINVPDKLLGLINKMEDLEQSREELSILGQQWDLLTILGQMSGSGTDMTGTREDFKELTAELLSTLGIETLNKTMQNLGSQAQVTVDIVIRNLFERTADIGFLSTDDDIRHFLQNSSDDPQAVQKLRDRFAEYVAKYSVYSDIILLDPQGKILCQLKDDLEIAESTDDILRESQSTNEAYVEVFRKTDLNPHDDESLIYAYKVTETNEAGSRVLGVLALVFRFEHELQMVFENLIQPDSWTVLTLLDSTGKVIACSDPSEVPLGAKVSMDPDKEFHVSKFGGRRYISKTCRTNGYQGFKGLGWLGHAMVPLEHAFNENIFSANDDKPAVASNVISAVTKNESLFSGELRSIPEHAQKIQSELDRTVWNGNVREDASTNDNSASARKVLLWEISTTGNKTRSVFEKSIGRLHETVVSSIFEDTSFMAELAIDIMDRNLYERANDCRWWSLTTAFREKLSKSELGQDDKEQCTNILQYINGLYTVYTNLFLFDRDGRIVAVSNPQEQGWVGKVVQGNHIQDCLKQSSTQDYTVSKFEKTALYGNKETYIYCSSVASLDDPNQLVGGIGVVFDSEPEFHAMLNDVLPKGDGGSVLPGYTAVFADRNRVVISSADPRFPVGATLSDIPEKFFQVKNGESYTGPIEMGDQHYAAGSSCSKGYREFKGEDCCYSNDVICLVLTQLGQVQEESVDLLAEHRSTRVDYGQKTHGISYQEFATFYVNGVWLGFKKSDVVECVDIGRVTPLPGVSKNVKGTMIFRDRPICILDPQDAFLSEGETFEPSQIVVVRIEETFVGILINELGEIPEVPEEYVESTEGMGNLGPNYIECVVRPSPSDKLGRMLVVLNAEKLFDSLKGSKPLPKLVGVQGGQSDQGTQEEFSESSANLNGEQMTDILKAVGDGSD